jgi:hypothetical protein
MNIHNLNAALRYSMDTVSNMLEQLAKPEHNHTRWGGENADHTFRGALADALDEQGRDEEASLLRNPKQSVTVAGRNGVRPVNGLDSGNFNAHINAIRKHLETKYPNGEFASVANSLPHVSSPSLFDGSISLSLRPGLREDVFVGDAGRLMAEEIRNRLSMVGGGNASADDADLHKLIDALPSVPYASAGPLPSERRKV